MSAVGYYRQCFRFCFQCYVYGDTAFSWCCSIKEVISSFRQISSGCSLNVLRLSMLMERNLFDESAQTL